MAGDLNTSHASPEQRLEALFSCSSSISESGVEHESGEAGFQKDQKLEEDKASRICVICFSEDGKAERGKLDSCDHYFCFVCIMEWARIESRCPACKGRFTVVHRMPKDDCRLPERILKIPIRNQAHSGFGNTTNDPYAETCCNVCKGVEDEGLMLLCDLCDSAAHTYCLGLGTNVPEGDWFCHDCTISRAQHADSEPETSGNNQNQTAIVEAHTSISDIVRESIAETVGMPCRRVLIHSTRKPPSIVPSWRSSMAHKTFPRPVDKASGTGARTLHRCRNIHGHIRALRENWGALRRGSLSFPSSSSAHGGNSSKQVIGAALNNQTGQPHFSTVRSFPQPSGRECDKSSSDVEKAWRMMEIAKAKAILEGDQTLRCPASRRISTNDKDSRTGKDPQCKIKKLHESAKDGYYSSLRKEMGKHRFLESDKQPCRPVASKKSKASNNEVLHTSSSSYEESPLGNVVQTFRGDFTSEIGRKPSKKTVDEVSSSSRMVEVSSSSRMVEVSGKGRAAREVSSDHDAKSEIRTLVKTNLKLLSRDKKLGYERFKEVARLATHTIMAACGLDPPPKSSMRFFSCSVCSHGEDVRQLHRSTLMPESCRECFLVYVKDVVNTIMSEK